jgi:hypothetical protein
LCDLLPENLAEIRSAAIHAAGAFVKGAQRAKNIGSPNVCIDITNTGEDICILSRPLMPGKTPEMGQNADDYVHNLLAMRCSDPTAPTTTSREE